MLKHVALQVTESDIKNFYSEVLKGSISKKPTLNEEVSEDLIQVSKQIDVYNLELNNLKLRLLVHDSIEQDSLQHLCFEMQNAQEVYKRANEAGYWCRTRKSGDNDVYYIRDKNRNMFELK